MLKKLLAPMLAVVALTLASVTSNAQIAPPKTVRELFNLPPQRYFPLEGCPANPTKKNCDKARVEYLDRRGL